MGKKLIFTIIILLVSCTLIFAFYYPRIPNSDIQRDDHGQDSIKSTGKAVEDTAMWNVTWGEEGLRDEFNEMVMGDDGYLYCIGTVYSYCESRGILLTKYDRNGTLVWNITWDGYQWDEGNGITIDENGSIYCTGFSDSFGDNNFITIKYHPNGTQAWNSSWGGDPLDNEGGSEVGVAHDGSIYCTGYISYFANDSSNMVLLKYDPNGNLIWDFVWRDYNESNGNVIVIDEEDYIYCGGYIFENGDQDAFLIKVHPNRTMMWNITWGTAFDNIYDMALSNESYIYTIGRNSLNASDFTLSKISLNGNLVYNITWGGKNTESGEGIVIDSENFIYCTGKSSTFEYEDIVIVKFDSNGTEIWHTSYDDINTNFAEDIEIDSDGFLYTSGRVYYNDTSKTDTLLVKFDVQTPQKPVNLLPLNGTLKLDNQVNLNVSIWDPNNDHMNVSFHDCSSDDLIGTAFNVPSGGVASINWTDLDWGTVYEWYAVANDGKYFSISPNSSFATNFAPGIPFNQKPENTSTIIFENIAFLEVNVSDPDDEWLRVFFYDAYNHTIIDIDEFARTGGISRGDWLYLTPNTTYGWYAVVSDGMVNISSPTCFFATKIDYTTATTHPYFIPSFEIEIIIYSIIILLVIYSPIEKYLVRNKKKEI
jgi:hypothetical protein